MFLHKFSYENLQFKIVSIWLGKGHIKLLFLNFNFKVLKSMTNKIASFWVNPSAIIIVLSNSDVLW